LTDDRFREEVFPRKAMKYLSWIIIFVSPLPIVLWALLPEFGIVSVDFLNSVWYKVILGVFIAIPVVASISFFIKPMLSFFGGSPRTRKILKYGLPADGVIKAINESSQGGVITVNDQPYVNLTIEVHDGMRAPYLVSLDTILPRVSVPVFQPGNIISLRVDPEDPQFVTIDWGRF